MKKILLIVSFLCLGLVCYSCKMAPGGGMWAPSDDSNGFSKSEIYGFEEGGYLFGENYNSVTENPFYETEKNNKSYFSMDSFTASYSNLRRYINSGMKLNGNIILTDELINYFDYDYEKPEGDETFRISSEMHEAPWNSEHQLLTVAVTTKVVELDPNLGNNYVFLIDVSGSMMGDTRLGLIKKSIPLLLEKLNPSDTISIVTYASGVRVELDGEKADNKSTITKSINTLTAGGGTNGEGGLKLAYETAEKHFIPGGNNRIILCTDGDFNLGNYTQDSLKEFVSQKRESGVYLTCLGFGMGNYQSTTMETLAKNGNGGYHYIDDIEEAKKVFLHDFNKTMVTVAKDTKTMVEFNQDTVLAYRLIGYENKKLTEDEYNDENKDAGEIGSGHTSVVCYELILKDEAESSDLCNIEIKYKDPITDVASSCSKGVKLIESAESENFLFVSGLAWFSMILRNSSYLKTGTTKDVVDRIENLESVKNDEFKSEFVELAKKAYGLVADPLYDNTRLLVIYGPTGIYYMKTQYNEIIDSNKIYTYLGILKDKRNYFKCYLDSDFNNELDNITMDVNYNVYLTLVGDK